MGTDIVVHPVGITHCADNANAWALIECGLVLTKKRVVAVEAAHASGSKRNYFYYSRRVLCGTVSQFL